MVILNAHVKENETKSLKFKSVKFKKKGEKCLADN